MLRLIDLREDKDLTGTEIAKLLNVSQPQYSRLELEVNKITSDKLIILSNFYNTSIDYILGLTNEIVPYKRSYSNTLKLKELRKSKKLTGKDAGEIIGLSQQQYSSIEKGEYKITYDKLITLANFYNTSVDYILGITDVFKPYTKPSFEIE